jgi:tubulin polyglutamylase TTLL5
MAAAEVEATEIPLKGSFRTWAHDRGQPCLVKLHGLKRPVFRFHPVSDLRRVKNKDLMLHHDGMAFGFKMLKSSSKLIIATLSQHGFREVHPNSSDYNIAWSGSHIKTHVYKTLSEHAKINHFPRSFE